jgi:oligogalacturonide transport system substrate-binding protein
VKQRIISVLTLLVFCLCLTSCELSGDTTVTRKKNASSIGFSWWGNDVRSEYTIESLKLFQNKTNITVEPRYCEFSGYKSWLDAYMAAGDTPDVMQVNYNWLYEYASQGYEFYDMSTLKDDIRLDNFSKEQLEFGMVNGKLMGIPIALNGMYFFYNADTLAKYGVTVPTTWDEFFAAGAKLKEHGVYIAEMGEKALWLCCVAYAEQKTGKPLFDSSNRLQYTPQEYQVILETYKKILDYNIIPRPTDFNHSDFFNGKAAGLLCWISDTKSYFSGNSGVNATSVNIAIGELLRISDETPSGWYKKPMALYCISKNTKQPQEAARLVDHLLNSEDMAQLQGTEKGVPLSKSAQEVLESRDMLSDLQAVADKKMNADPNIKTMSSYLENDKLMKIFYTLGDDVTYNNADVGEKSREMYLQAREIPEIPRW